MSLCTASWKADVYYKSYSSSWFSTSNIRIGKAGLYLVKVNGTGDSGAGAHHDMPLRISTTSTSSSGDVFGVLPTPRAEDSGTYYQPFFYDGEFYVRAIQDNMYINWTVSSSQIMRGGITAVRIGV